MARLCWLASTVRVDTLEKQVGQLVQRLRKKAGLSQETLADRAGLHRTYISLLERGLRMPSLGVVQKLAAALNTTMSKLMKELERPRR